MIFQEKKLLMASVLLPLVTTLSSLHADDKKVVKSPISGKETRDLLSAINTEVISPAFKHLANTSLALTNKSTTFCQSQNSENFKQMRISWKQTAMAWQGISSFHFGPTVDENIDFAIYFLPIKKRVIKKLLKKPEVTSKVVDDAGVGAQGLGSIEYLLFSRDISEQEILKTFKKNDKRCEYLVANTRLLNENIATISRQWKHYGEQFAIAGDNSLFFNEADEAKEVLINKLYQASQKISLKKLRIPVLGKNDAKGNNHPAPYKLEAWRSGSSLAQIKAGIEGIQNILDKGKVLDWLKENNKKTLADNLQKTIKSVYEIEIPKNDLFNVLQTNNESPDQLRLVAEKLTQLIKLQLAPTLGVQLGFNDNDGD